MSKPYHYDCARDKVLSIENDETVAKQPSESERWAFVTLEEQVTINRFLEERLEDKECESYTSSLRFKIYDDLSFLIKAALVVALIFVFWGTPSPISKMHSNFNSSLSEQKMNKSANTHKDIRTVTAQEFQENFDDIIEDVKNGEHVKITDGLTSAVIVSDTEFNLLKGGFSSIAD